MTVVHDYDVKWQSSRTHEVLERAQLIQTPICEQVVFWNFTCTINGLSIIVHLNHAYIEAVEDT